MPILWRDWLYICHTAWISSNRLADRNKGNYYQLIAIPFEIYSGGGNVHWTKK